MGLPELYEVLSGDAFRAPLAYLDMTHQAVAARFAQSLRYVTLHRSNAKTFSYEFASILRDACSAFGSFSGTVIWASCPTGRRERLGITDFFDFYSSKSNTDLTAAYVDVISLRDALQPAHRLQPFRAWTRDNRPPWWTAYNNIKHSEYDHAHEGTLQNATNALAAVEMVLRCSTGNQKGTALFSPWGGPWDPRQQGTEQDQPLFDP